VTNDKKQPGLPVVEVDQAFPLLTTDGTSRSTGGTAPALDQGPAISAAIRDVLGWRPRAQDPKAFKAALTASFELSMFEDHVVARYTPRGVAVQADLGSVTGGQASLYLRAKAAHEQITRMLDSLKPLRTDADPEDCEAYRSLVRDSVRRIVMELGREGGPRVALVDSAFATLTGSNPAASAGPVQPGGGQPGGQIGTLFNPAGSVGSRGPVPLAPAAFDPDTVPGQLGALRDRFGLDDDHVNTIDEEKQRTSFWTLVELITDLQRSWTSRRLQFTFGQGNGFLGTDLVQMSRLLAAAAEQVEEFEGILDSVLVSPAERQTVLLDRTTGLTLDDLLQWMHVFFTEDGPNIIRDTGRDGLVSSFTPTVVDILLTLRNALVRRLVPCCGPSCAGGCLCGSRGSVICIPLGCCTKLPPGMYSGRVKIAVSTLCGLVERLADRAIRIGRFAGVVLLDLTITPFRNGGPFVRVEVRGLHLRPTYVPAFVTGPNPQSLDSFVLPLQGSASADEDSLTGVFDENALPAVLQGLVNPGDSVVVAASEVPLGIVDGELGRVVQGPSVTTWPKLRLAHDVNVDGAPNNWGSIDPNQRFVPQSPPDPLPPQVADDILQDCTDDCTGCDCVCHALKTVHSGLTRLQRIAREPKVGDALDAAINEVGQNLNNPDLTPAKRLLAVLGSEGIRELLKTILAVDCPPEEGEQDQQAPEEEQAPEEGRAAFQTDAPPAFIAELLEADGYRPASGVYDGIEVSVPDIGDFSDVPVIDIHVSPYDVVAVDDPLITLESDKGTMEVPATATGRVGEIKVNIGDSVSAGHAILDIYTYGPPAGGPTAAPTPSPVGGDSEASYVTPLVRKLAKEHAVDLASLHGTGVGGRIRAQDVLAAAEAAKQTAAAEKEAAAAPQKPAAGEESRLDPTSTSKTTAAKTTAAKKAPAKKAPAKKAPAKNAVAAKAPDRKDK
jgi:biotin carboxyl carrier protein